MHRTSWLVALMTVGLFPLLAPGDAAALTLDFGDGVHEWNDPNSNAETYTIGGGTVTVTVRADTGGALDRNGNPPSPETNGFLNPPDNAANNPNPESLFLRTQGNDTAPYVRITIDFNYAFGVTDVAFQLFDVDAAPGQWIDQIRVVGRDVNDPAIRHVASSVSDLVGGAPSWSWNGGNTITGTGDSQLPAPNNTGDNGTAVVEFMGSTIDRLIFRYANLDPAAGNQWVSIGDVSFTPVTVPEPDTAALLTLGLVGLVIVGRPRNRRV